MSPAGTDSKFTLRQVAIRQVLPLVVGTVLVTSYLFWIPLGEETPGTLDLPSFWAWSKAFLESKNPYDHALVNDLLLSQGWSQTALVGYYPPWTFPVFAWLALLPLSSWLIIWLPLCIFLFGLILIFLGQVYGLGQIELDRRLITRLLPILVLATYVPILAHLKLGQVCIISLLGLTIFLGFHQTKQVRLKLLAGIGLTLTLMKPHLFLLLYIWIFIFSTRKRDWPLLIGWGCGSLALLLSSWWLNPGIFLYYFQSAPTPVNWHTPTIGAWIQYWIDPHNIAWRFSPILLGLLAVLFLSRRGEERFPLWLIPLNLITTPYLWTYDYILLVPVVIALMATPTSSRANFYQVLLLAANIVLMLGSTDMKYEIWYPMFISILLIDRSKKRA